MAITYEQLKAVNENMTKVPIKGKDYAQVNDRVKAFRQLCPMGSIETEILEIDDGVVTMKAIIMDDEGHVLATGMAQEKESSSFINKTSFIENCETSAVGRALGFAGIGVDGSMASAEEVANAILNQNERPSNDKEKIISDKEVTILKNLCEQKGLDITKTFPKGLAIPVSQYTDVLNQLKNLKDKA